MNQENPHDSFSLKEKLKIWLNEYDCKVYKKYKLRKGQKNLIEVMYIDDSCTFSFKAQNSRNEDFTTKHSFEHNCNTECVKYLRTY